MTRSDPHPFILAYRDAMDHIAETLSASTVTIVAGGLHRERLYDTLREIVEQDLAEGRPSCFYPFLDPPLDLRDRDSCGGPEHRAIAARRPGLILGAVIEPHDEDQHGAVVIIDSLNRATPITW